MNFDFVVWDSKESTWFVFGFEFNGVESSTYLNNMVKWSIPKSKSCTHLEQTKKNQHDFQQQHFELNNVKKDLITPNLIIGSAHRTYGFLWWLNSLFQFASIRCLHLHNDGLNMSPPKRTNGFKWARLLIRLRNLEAPPIGSWCPSPIWYASLKWIMDSLCSFWLLMNCGSLVTTIVCLCILVRYFDRIFREQSTFVNSWSKRYFLFFKQIQS